MRRSHAHVLGNNKVYMTRSGDQHIKSPQFNVAQVTFPDSDPRWGLSPDDPDYPTESHIGD